MFADRACDRSDPEFPELAILRDIDRSEYWESRRNTVASTSLRVNRAPESPRWAIDTTLGTLEIVREGPARKSGNNIRLLAYYCKTIGEMLSIGTRVHIVVPPISLPATRCPDATSSSRSPSCVRRDMTPSAEKTPRRSRLTRGG